MKSKNTIKQRDVRKILAERKTLQSFCTIRDISKQLGIKRAKVDSIIYLYKIGASKKDSSGVKYFNAEKTKIIMEMITGKVYQPSDSLGGNKYSIPANHQEGKAVIGRQEVSDILGISLRTLDRCTQLKQGPRPIVIGNTNKWLKSSVFQWLENQQKLVDENG